LISDSALKDLNSLETKIREQIKSSLKELEVNPFRKRPKADIKKLKGLKDPELYRLRIRDYRIVFSVNGKFVNITHIIKRSKVYQNLD
jgi:mRNA interferase RelE/StbE